MNQVNKLITSADLGEILFDRVPKPLKFENELWEAADNLRASARLKSSEYAAPLLGLFFLRYSSNRFEALKNQAEEKFEAQQGSRLSKPIADIYRGLCGFYLPEPARYETLLNLTDADNIQQAVIAAMTAFEEENKDAGVKLPKNDYLKIPHKTLREIINIISGLKVAEGDVFGRIYEYFLGKFALSEGQKGGEFYTPTSVVKLIVEVIEPFKSDARVFDPACGTGGMFVQSAKFVERHTGMQRLSIYGQEKVNETANLGRLNLFVNGLKGDIHEVDSSLSTAAYVDDRADTFGKFDFVMANPPFNVDSVKIEDIGKNPLFTTYGTPVSQAKSGKQSDTFSNANYLWVSLFATALNKQGRAGFVMANSASDARGGELEVRSKLVDAGIVDVMITIGPNFFYTVTLPVTLWFFDKAKTNSEHPRRDQTLFIDARKIFSSVHGSRTQREFSQSQLLNLASIVWLYRGENDKYRDLRELYERARVQWQDAETTNEDTEKIYKGIKAHRVKLAAAFRDLAVILEKWHQALPVIDKKQDKLFADNETDETLLKSEIVGVLPEIAVAGNSFSFRDAADWQQVLTSLKVVGVNDLIDKAAINSYQKQAEEAVLFAYKVLRPEKDKTFNRADIRPALKRLSDEREDTLFVLERITYFAAQAEWLDTNFPEGVWRDVEGLCKIATRAEIEEQNFSLNPGRYVGVAMEDDGLTEAEFREFMLNNAEILQSLHTEADELQRLIAEDLTDLFTEAKAEAV